MSTELDRLHPDERTENRNGRSIDHFEPDNRSFLVRYEEERQVAIRIDSLRQESRKIALEYINEGLMVENPLHERERVTADRHRTYAEGQAQEQIAKIFNDTRDKIASSKSFQTVIEGHWISTQAVSVEGEEESVIILLTGGSNPHEAEKVSIFPNSITSYLECNAEGGNTRVKGQEAVHKGTMHDAGVYRKIVDAFTA